jgi:hypothetical protein
MNGGPPGNLEVSGDFPLAEAITGALHALPGAFARN